MRALLNTPSKGIHQVDNIGRLGSLGSFDWLPSLLFLSSSSSASSYWSSNLAGSNLIQVDMAEGDEPETNILRVLLRACAGCRKIRGGRQLLLEFLRS